MKVLVSGGTGLVGRYIVEGLLEAGYRVIVGSRSRPSAGLFSRSVEYVPLSLDPELDQIDAFENAYFFVHAAFDHLPGRYRGGEGNEPERFRRLNLDGTIRLYETAKRAGTRRAVFLSSRAVYDGQPGGELLTESQASRPDSLYGEVKLHAERALAAMSVPGFATASLRLTGVYGGLTPNKWDEIFCDYTAGRPVTSRAGTEVHGRDVAAAVRLMLESEVARIDGRSFNVSDFITETREILGLLPSQPYPLPAPVDRSAINIMDTSAIEKLGWAPAGRTLLAETVAALAARISAAA